MSIHAMTWAFAQRHISPTEKFILLALADHCDAEGTCYPSQERLAGRTNMSVRTVIRGMAALESKGFITRRRRSRVGRRITDVITLLMSAEVELEPLPDNLSDDTEGPPDIDDEPTCHPDQKPPDTVSEEPSEVEPSENRQASPPPIGSPSPSELTMADHLDEALMTAVTGPALGVNAGGEALGGQPGYPAGRPHGDDDEPPAAYPMAFEAFWAAWPNKVGKAPAFRAWERTVYPQITPDLCEKILAGVKRYDAHVQAQRAGGFALSYQAPYRWLSDQRWTDEHQESTQGEGQTSDQIAAYLRNRDKNADAADA